jgi:cytochrome c
MKPGEWFKLFLVALFSLGLCLPAYGSDHPSKEEVVKFVEEGLKYAKENGKEAFLKEIINPTGSFKRGELYFYAYDFNGVVLAHGAKPDLVGKNLINMTDVKGQKMIEALRDTAAKGCGWVEFSWQNPVSKKVESKLGYVVKLDDTCWFGSGTYLEE